MRRIFFAIPFAVLATTALGADKPAAPPPSTLTVNDCLVILQGLNGLDLHQVVVNQGKPNEQVAMIPFEFGSARLRLTIGHNLAELGAVQRDAQAAQQKIQAEIGKGGEIKPGTPANLELDRQVRDLLTQPCRASIDHIQGADLKLDKNEIPGSVLGALDKILDR